MLSMRMVQTHTCIVCNMSIYILPAKLCEEMLGLKAVQQLSTLLATPGEGDATVDMGLRALHVLVTSGEAYTMYLLPSLTD